MQAMSLSSFNPLLTPCLKKQPLYIAKLKSRLVNKIDFHSAAFRLNSALCSPRFYTSNPKAEFNKERHAALLAKISLEKAVSIFKEGTCHPFLLGEDKGLYELSHFVPRHESCLKEIIEAWKLLLKTSIGQQGISLNNVNFTQSSFLAFRKALRETSTGYPTQSFVPFMGLNIDWMTRFGILKEVRKIEMIKNDAALSCNKHYYQRIDAQRYSLRENAIASMIIDSDKWEIRQMELALNWCVKQTREFNEGKQNYAFQMLGTEEAVKTLATFISRSDEAQDRIVKYWSDILSHPLIANGLILESVEFSICSFKAFCCALEGISKMHKLAMVDCAVDRYPDAEVKHLLSESLRQCKAALHMMT